jgi:hypothetical protein
MAFIREFILADGKGKMHPTEVTARVKVFQSPDRAPILQIDTNGSAGRQIPGKLSQTLQLDRASAQQLFVILKQTYNLG